MDAKIPVTIAFNTAMRMGEVLSLRWDQIRLNVNEETGKIMLDSDRIKPQKSRMTHPRARA